MRYVLKHNNKEFFFLLLSICAYYCGYVDISGHLHLTQGRIRLHPYVVVPLEYTIMQSARTLYYIFKSHQTSFLLKPDQPDA